MKYCLYLFISAFIFTACKKENARPFSALKVAGCESAIVSGNNIKICLDSVISDSRCPLQMTCVWAGTAIAKFSISIDGQSPQIHELVIKSHPFHTYSSSVIQQGYQVTFLTLSPYPGETSDGYSNKKAGLEVIKL